MARHTTFRIGGPVRLMALPRSEGEVLACLREAERARVRLVVLGNGSNLLAADGEIPCFAVLLTGLDALERTGERRSGPGRGCLWPGWPRLPPRRGWPAWSLPTASRGPWGAAC